MEKTLFEMEVSQAGRRRGSAVAVKSPSTAQPSRLRDLCHEDKQKVVGLITELKGVKERSRSVVAQRKADQEKYVSQYQHLQEKYMELQESYAALQRKYDQSLQLLQQARDSKTADTPEERREVGRRCITSAGKRTDRGRKVTVEAHKKPSEEVRDLHSMITHLSQSVHRLNESVLKPSPDPAISLRIPSSNSPLCLNDTAQSGKSVHLQPLNLNTLFEDPDQEEKVAKVLARARRVKGREKELYGQEFYQVVQEMEQGTVVL